MLTYEKVKESAKNAYLENRLLAQSGTNKYAYRIVIEDAKEYLCAIGAALSDNQLNEISRNELDTFQLNDLSLPTSRGEAQLNMVIPFETSRDYYRAKVLQKLHDNLQAVNHKNGGNFSQKISNYEKRFERLIGLR